MSYVITVLMTKQNINIYKKDDTPTWTTYILGSVAFFVAGVMSLSQANRNFGNASTFTISNNHIGYSANIVMSLVSTALALVSLIWMYLFGFDTPARKQFEAVISNNTVLPWMLAFGAFFFMGNTLFFSGLVRAPNPGYARAVMTIEVVIITVLSAIIYGSPLGIQTGIGIVLACIGIVMVTSNGKKKFE